MIIFNYLILFIFVIESSKVKSRAKKAVICLYDVVDVPIVININLFRFF